MSDLVVAKRYSRAIFELATGSGDLAMTEGLLKSLKDVTTSHPQFLRLISNPTLSDEEKYRLVQNLLPPNTPELLDHFLKILIIKKRFSLLSDIQMIFHKMFEKKQGLQEVEVASPSPLSSDFQEKLTVVLKKKLRAEIRLIPKVETNLLGGFVLRFDGREIDCSFKNRIYEIQQKLFGSLEKGTA